MPCPAGGPKKVPAAQGHRSSGAGSDLKFPASHAHPDFSLRQSLAKEGLAAAGCTHRKNPQLSSTNFRGIRLRRVDTFRG